MAHPLKIFRDNHDLTQEALAKRLGVKRETLARWEIGSRKVSQKLLDKIVKRTGVAARELRPDLAKRFEAVG